MQSKKQCYPSQVYMIDRDGSNSSLVQRILPIGSFEYRNFENGIHGFTSFKQAKEHLLDQLADKLDQYVSAIERVSELKPGDVKK